MKIRFKRTHAVSAVLRRLALLLLVVMLLPTVAACKNRGEQNGETEPPTKEEEIPMEIPENLAITAAGGFRYVNGILTAYITQDSSVLDFSNRINVPKGATWKLYADKACTTLLEGKKATMREGENRYYIAVKHRSETFTHELLVNYHAAYTVEFFTNCNYMIETQKVENGKAPEEPATPIRDGYVFLGWHLNGALYDFSDALDEDIILVAHWSRLNDNFSASNLSAPKFEGLNASLNAVWKDYDNSFGLRPSEVTCILTELCGEEKTEYRITLKRDSATWQGNAPTGATLAQAASGAWSISIKNLPETKNGLPCSYTLLQLPLSGDYSTVQSRNSSINTISGYMPSADASARLSTRNGRLYDAAGNMVVLNGAVPMNAGTPNLDVSVSTKALTRLKETGCNAIRLTAQLIGRNPGEGYVYYSNGSARTDSYDDSKDRRVSEEDKQKMLASIYSVIDNATEVGMYVVIDWGILTGNPNKYLNEALEFFGILSQKYADNPYLIYEICNEPQATWGTGNGENQSIKAYAEKVIRQIRLNGSQGIVIVAPNNSATALSAYTGRAAAGDDPIDNPIAEDLAYNVAYTFHCYPYNYTYSSTDTKVSTYAWRLRDAHEAGLTVISTEMSPMDATFDGPSTITYDMEEMAKYLRMYQEWDISFFFFRYASPISQQPLYYHDNYMFLPNVNLTMDDWSREDLTRCGKWFYDLLTQGSAFVMPDYNAQPKKFLRPTVDSLYSNYGIQHLFPGFAISAEQNESTLFFGIASSDTLTAHQYHTYCRLIWEQISESGSSVQQANGSAFEESNLPQTTADTMDVTYKYYGKTVHLRISYGKNAADTAYGVTVTVQEVN